jgi:hypothetical protein
MAALPAVDQGGLAMIDPVRKLLTIGATAVTMALVFAFFADVPGAQAPPSGAGGWTSLFDGKTLAGWRGYRRPDASGTRWVVQEGMLCVDPKAAPSGRDLVTVNTYRDFELAWEWRIAQAGNSGVKYLVLEDQNSAIGHEYQLADDERHPDATTGKRQTASFYDVLPAANRPLRPAGQMNESRIVVSGQTVQHWLNGTKVLEYTLDSPAVRAAIADSKFAKVERFGKPHQAHILLQDHNDPVCYRNIRIRAGS